MRTKEILEAMDYLERRKERRELIRYIAREILRFLALLAGTSIFTFIAVPVMELWPQKTMLMAEMLAVLAFALWLGTKFYAPKKKRK